MAIEELKSHKSPGIDQIPAELIKTGGRKIPYEIYKLIISIWKKEELPEEWKESIVVPIYKKGDKTNCSNYMAHLFCQLHTKFIQHPALKVNSICRGNYCGSSMWILTQQVNYWSYILHLSNTWGKMGIQWTSASPLYRLPASLLFS